MKAAVLSLPLALCLSAQSPVENLKSDLQALRTAPPPANFSRQVGTHILLLAEKTHEPTASTLQEFANSLVGALAGRSLTKEDIDGMAADILHVMHSAGTSTIGFQETVQDFEERLTKAGVAQPRSHLVASNLERVGKDVQGPQDLPLMKIPLPRVRQ